MSTGGHPILEANNVCKQFESFGWRRKRPTTQAVEDLSLALYSNETVALVGESGCGKTTTARMLLHLEVPSSGSVRFDGIDLKMANHTQIEHYRASVQAVFQDPWSSLNPRMRIGDIIAEPLVINGFATTEITDRVKTALTNVGIEEAALRSFPHEFSGGQRQRIAIARAIALRPRVIVLDEPVSSLDVSVRAQIMNLLKDLRSTLGMSYLLISHDLATVRFLANRVFVMRHGRIVEEGDADVIFERPVHPYTEALIAAARIVRPGAPPSSTKR